MIAGILAGVSQVLVGHPFDTLKVRIQNKKLHFNQLYSGWKSPMVSSIVVNGILFPIYENYRQHYSAFTSGAISGAFVTPIVFLFDTYKIQMQMSQPLSFSFTGLPSTLAREVLAFGIYFESYEQCKNYTDSSLTSGAFAGLTNWFFTYPIDVVRSRQISQKISIREALSQGKLYSGISICLLRAMLVNSAVFATYDFFK